MYASGLMERRRFGAWVCAALFLLCLVLIHPVAESGINDDWSIVRSAQVFANTGHLRFNGWEAPMCLWNIWTGALSIKLFGFSFFAVRLAVMVHGLLLVVLLQRSAVRSGLSELHSVFVTLCVMLSPVFLGCTTLAMSDIVGLLALVICFYACLRAVQARSPLYSGLWLCAATVFNCAFSTSRQIDFIGALVLVPSAAYILRRNKGLVTLAAMLWLFSLGFIAYVLRWFSRQPYILPQAFMPHPFIKGMLFLKIPSVLACAALDSALLIFPMSFMLAPVLRRVQARNITIACSGVVTLLIWNALTHQYQKSAWIAPFNLITFYSQTPENTFNAMIMPPHGMPPSGLSLLARGFLTCISLFGVAVALLAVLSHREGTRHEGVREGMEWTELLILTLPTLSAYALLLLPRGVLMTPSDRYLLGFLPTGSILIARFCVSHYGPRISQIAWSSLLLLGLYSIVTVHDTFATFRANLEAIRLLRNNGIAREAIDGGWEWDFDTQVLNHGHTEASGITLPGGRILYVDSRMNFDPCGLLLPAYSPDVNPRYAIAWSKSQCSPDPAYPAVSYATWFPPFRRELHIVRAVQ